MYYFNDNYCIFMQMKSLNIIELRGGQFKILSVAHKLTL